LEARGDKKSRKQLKQGLKNISFSSAFINFPSTWATLLHLVQKGYTPSSARGVQKWVTTVAPLYNTYKAKTCQVLNVVSVVKINYLIMLKLCAFPKQWSPYQVLAYLKISRNGLKIRWPAHLKILKKLHAFLRNGLNIGWSAHLKILRKLHAFLRKWSQYQVTGPP